MRNYKMIRVFENEQRHLFDVNADIGEQNDLAMTKPDILAAMDKRLTEYLTLVKAGLPTPNPNYDPNGERSGDRKGGGGKGGPGGKGKKGMKPATAN